MAKLIEFSKFAHILGIDFHTIYFDFPQICSSPARGGSDSKAIDQSRDISTNQEQEPALTHWEKWLIEKTKLERKKVREEVRKKLAELKAKEEQEHRNRERRRHIESQVVEWLKEKEKEEKKQRAKEARRKQKEENEKNMMRQKQLEKDKVGILGRMSLFDGVY